MFETPSFGSSIRISLHHPGRYAPREHLIRFRILKAVGILLVAVPVGCSGAPHRTAAPTTAASSTTIDTATIAVPTTNTATTVSALTVPDPSSTSAPAAIPHCQPGNLQATISGQGGGTGHGGEIVMLRLLGGAPCSTGGYPGLGLRNAASQPVPLTVERQTHAGFLFPYVKQAAIVVTATTPISFGLEWINQSALPATTLIVTPPNDTSSIVATGGVDGGVPNNSVVTVTALTTVQLPPPCGIACGG